MSRWFVPLGALLVATAAAQEHVTPGLFDPLPFDHAAHDRIFRAQEVTCVHCHPMGARVRLREGTKPPESLLEPSLGSCHGCHLQELPGAPRRAPSTCTTCHADRAALAPESHGVGWIEAHAPAARARQATCRDCHDVDGCVDCHEARGATARSPHPPGFGTFHGIEARLDPRSCSSCHTEARCADCHETGALPW